MKRFNITGTCFADKHYMVNIDDRVQQIKKMVDRGDYFCINRGRQYGKTTTLHFLKKALDAEYTVFSISFEGMSDSSFSSLERCGQAFFEKLMEAVDYEEVNQLDENAKNCLFKINEISSDKELSLLISKFVKLSSRPIVIIIDEVDQAGNHDAFIKFLGLLRDKYLNRETRPTFHSVILAGVYDVKNLKLKIRSDEQHQYNSPWNIAAPFEISMELDEPGIKGMLEDYESDHHTGMDTSKIAHLLSEYTSGYPFLVSRLCMIIDEKLDADWSEQGFLEAVKIILSEKNTLFDDMIKKLSDFSEMKNLLKKVLYNGEKIPYNSDDKQIEIATMFNFVKNNNGTLAVSNRIFETRLYNLFLFEAGISQKDDTPNLSRDGSIDKPLFINNGHLDMTKVMERFALHFNEIYDSKDEKFIEKQGRKFFLFFLKPIINGTGNFYVEAQTRDERRMDVVVDYNGERFVIEMKIWHGNSYNERGEQQLAEYLDYYGLEKGYLLSFCFNKNKDSNPSAKEITVGNKTIFEVIV